MIHKKLKTGQPESFTNGLALSIMSFLKMGLIFGFILAGYSIYKNYTLEAGDILLSVVGTIGRVAIFKENYKAYAFQRSVAFMRFKESLPEFIYQLFLANDFQNELLVRQVVSAQPGIYLGDLSKIEISLPCLDEQTKIANFLSAIDQKIDVVSTQLKQAKIWKKGLLQQMFV